MNWRQVHIENVLGTSLELQLAGVRDDDARRAERTVLEEIDRLSSILSTYSPDSELSQWQTTLDFDAVVSSELAEVLDLAEHWRVSTGGAFNPAARAIADRLQTGGAVDDDLVAQLRGPLWTIDRRRGLARRLVDLPISLDAIAKGYIVSRAAARARDVSRATDVLLNIGGDIQHIGVNAVVVGITDPASSAENAPCIAQVGLFNAALATSGGYRRGFDPGGGWRSHIVDPRTGKSAGDVASASVIAPEGAAADALSAAFSVLSRRESLALADSIDGIGCLLVERDGRVSMSKRWNAR